MTPISTRPDWGGLGLLSIIMPPETTCRWRPTGQDVQMPPLSTIVPLAEPPERISSVTPLLTVNSLTL